MSYTPPLYDELLNVLQTYLDTKDGRLARREFQSWHEKLERFCLDERVDLLVGGILHVAVKLNEARQARIRSLIVENGHLDAEAADLRRDVRILERENERLTRQNADLEKANEKLRAEVADLAESERQRRRRVSRFERSDPT